ncbi:MAG: trypsin-like peptidase domain-containing protein [Oscillospiraceae bacterium]|nr:trypsin-like peptidase domain-containing protein [Oscillospiraceae bacterium]
MNNHTNYIWKQVSIKFAALFCVGTLTVGGLAGFGGSRIAIEMLNLISGTSSGSSGYTGNGDNGPYIPDDLNRAIWQGVPSEKRPSEAFDAATLFENRGLTVVGVKLIRDVYGTTETTDIIGSGVLVSEDGFILTNAHVIEGGTEAIVVVDDYDNPAIKNEYKAEIFGYDTATDLALLKIERPEPFRFSPIGKSGDLRVGQSVVIIGNPMGLEKSITQGIVSGLKREIGDNPFMLPSIQTDAAVNPGNSGGPMFNMYGEVVGIVNIKYVSAGGMLDNLGFAIPIDEAMTVIDDLAKHGKVMSRPMLGITAQPYNDGEYSGLEVLSVTPGTPAAKSGLSRNDIITHIEGEIVNGVPDIQAVLRGKNVGDEITLTIIRYNNAGVPSEKTLRFELISASDS